jgi:hypothetical protein
MQAVCSHEIDYLHEEMEEEKMLVEAFAEHEA